MKLKYILKLLLIFSTLLFATNLEQKAAIIFDASGSMWGRIDGKIKIDIAKDALKDVIKHWKKDIPLGLTIYGHRKKADCNDIETVIPVSTINPQKMLNIIKDIEPKGKTPIIRSLQKVANELEYKTDKATIILISDGKETCDSNPIEAIKKLKKDAKDLVIHVIGFNVDKEASKELENIAQAADGTYLPAKNASSLSKAVKVIANKVQKVNQIVKPDKNLEISASETTNGNHIQALHQIFSENNLSKIIDSCISYRDKICKLHMAQGKYKIVSTYNLYKKSTSINIYENNITKVNIVMGQTGTLKVTAKELKGGELIAPKYSIYNNLNILIPAPFDSKTKILQTRLPIGKYLLKYKYSNYQNQKAFLINANKETKLEIITGKTGELNLTASKVKNGKNISANYAILPIDKKEFKPLSCNSEANKACVLHLGVGEYLIKSSFNNLKREDNIKIEYKKVLHKHIIFKPTGYVNIKAYESNKSKAILANFSIYKNSKLIIGGQSSPRKNIKLELFEGNYTLKANYIGYKKSLNFKIEANKEKNLKLIMGESGYLNVLAILQRNSNPIYPQYTIFKDNNNSKIVASSCQKLKSGDCNFHLPIGSYTIKAEYPPFVKSKTFKITPQNKTKIVFVMNPSGTVEISAKEADNKKEIEAFYNIYKVINNEANRSKIIDSCKSEKGYKCSLNLPVGKYLLSTKYNNFKQERFFEIKDGKITPINILIGTTGDLYISVYENNYSKPLHTACNYIIRNDGNKSIIIADDCYSLHVHKKLPVGHYKLRTEYNDREKITNFDIFSGQKTKLSVIMGETGKVIIHTFNLQSKKHINADLEFYKIVKNKKPKQLYIKCWYDKKIDGCKVKLFVGEYIIKSIYKETKKIPFNIEYNKTKELSITY